MFQALAFLIGAAMAAATVLSAVRTFVVPRAEQSRLTRAVFVAVRFVFGIALLRGRSYQERDHIMAYYAPVALLTLLPVWLTIVTLGFTAMFWSLGIGDWFAAFKVSGSSLLTLGFAPVESIPQTMLAFIEATTGLILLSVSIAYLPTMYAAFARRESAVTMLEVRAGSPPSAIEMIERYHRIHGLDHLNEVWQTWEAWFVDIEESHTSLPSLVFFRSPQPNRSWATATGAVLDAASLVVAVVDIPPDPQAVLCIRAGFLALRRLADFFRFPYDPDPKPTDPISITRLEFDIACNRLASKGIPLKADREQAWRDFAGWRVNYDAILLALCDLTMAPYAPWSSDRATGRGRVQSAR
jgi:hypothetical protein